MLGILTQTSVVSHPPLYSVALLSGIGLLDVITVALEHLPWPQLLYHIQASLPEKEMLSHIGLIEWGTVSTAVLI